MMNDVKLSTIVFRFLDEFFLQEASGKEWMASKNCQKERWSICDECEYFDEPEEGREGPLPSGWQVRLAILACVLTTVFVGLAGDSLIRICEMAAQSLNYGW